jgi:hypothetical protein
MDRKLSDFWEVAAAHRRFLKRKLCLAESEMDPCKSAIVEAHTIPRSQLKSIARNGHVYAGPSLEQMVSSVEMPLLREVGIGKFSTLSCFCARHDKQIFSDVEDIPLIFTPRRPRRDKVRDDVVQYIGIGWTSGFGHDLVEGPQYLLGFCEVLY